MKEFDTGKMQISTKAFVVLVAALMLSLMVVAYLLGRESSGRPAPPAVSAVPRNTETDFSSLPSTPYRAATEPYLDPPQPPVPSPVAVLPRFDPPQAVRTPQSLPGTPQSLPGTPRSLPGASRQITPHPRNEDNPAAAGARAEVEAYFARLDAISSGAKYWDDPNAMAQECLKAAMGGDTSGIDRLIGAYKAAQSKINALTAPADCRDHHHRTLEMMSKSVNILESIKSGITSGDMSRLTTLSDDAQDMKQKADALEQQTQSIKARHGIR